MRRSCALALLMTFAAPAAAQESTTDPQELFRATLLADDGTTKSVKRMLRSGDGFVEPSPAFADVTGDGKSDALVRVMTGGAGGAVAVYVLSTDGTKSSDLRVVFGRQLLYRATVKVDDVQNLVVRTPVYAAGDDMCCPGRARDRTYAWRARPQTLRKVADATFTLE